MPSHHICQFFLHFFHRTNWERYTLQLFALAYNLGNFLRRLALPRKINHGTLTTLREKLIQIGAKVIRHARYITFQLAEVAVPRKLFEAILQKINRLRLLSETG